MEMFVKRTIAQTQSGKARILALTRSPNSNPMIHVTSNARIPTRNGELSNRTAQTLRLPRNLGNVGVIRPFLTEVMFFLVGRNGYFDGRDHDTPECRDNVRVHFTDRTGDGRKR